MIRVIKWLVLLGAFGLTTVASGSDDRTIYGGKVVALERDTSWDLNDLTFEGGGTIITNGHSLVVNVRNNLVITGESPAQIISFEPSHPYPTPQAPAKAAGGQSFDSGPNTSGPGASARGADGGQGMAGIPGSPGQAGRSAGSVLIFVWGKASGTLLILNIGENGGAGGAGGEGEDGGNGQQGGRAVGQESLLGLVIGCASGPGSGGNGGNGGIGGNGGPGGNGGSGGDVVVVVQGSAADFNVHYRTSGGAGGVGGLGGRGGRPGNPGYGGRGSAGCSGRETERMGSPGSAGSAGSSGPSGTDGSAGRFTAFGSFRHAEILGEAPQ